MKDFKRKTSKHAFDQEKKKENKILTKKKKGEETILAKISNERVEHKVICSDRFTRT